MPKGFIQKILDAHAFFYIKSIVDSLKSIFIKTKLQVTKSVQMTSISNKSATVQEQHTMVSDTAANDSTSHQIAKVLRNVEAILTSLQSSAPEANQADHKQADCIKTKEAFVAKILGLLDLVSTADPDFDKEKEVEQSLL